MAVLARLNSNRLRELEGFLGHLLADILVAVGLPQNDTLTGLREKSMLRRLRVVEMHLNLDFGVERRLIALARIAAALRRPAAKSCQQRLGRDVRIAAALPETSASVGVLPLGEPVILTVCTFYQSLADRLVSAITQHRDKHAPPINDPVKRIACA